MDEPKKLGRTHINIGGLVFADDLTILARDTATAQSEFLENLQKSIGLQILSEKTDFVTTLKSATKYLNIKYGEIKDSIKLNTLEK